MAATAADAAGPPSRRAWRARTRRRAPSSRFEEQLAALSSQIADATRQLEDSRQQCVGFEAERDGLAEELARLRKLEPEPEPEPVPGRGSESDSGESEQRLRALLATRDDSLRALRVEKAQLETDARKMQAELAASERRLSESSERIGADILKLEDMTQRCIGVEAERDHALREWPRGILGDFWDTESRDLFGQRP